MARAEIDSFILKFKRLLLSGRDATLVIKSNAGKAEVSLNVVLGDVPPPPDQQHLQQSRNGPSRQRRRIRRTEARKAEADEAKKAGDDKSNTEEVIKIDTVQEKDTSPVINKTLEDEFCSDDIFNANAKESVDETQVEKILVEADCQADWKDDYVRKLVQDKLRMIGIEPKAITVNRNIRKCFESCIVRIEPTRKDLIEKQIFPIRRWTMKCIL
jgi:hypothetical protein